MTLFLFFVVGVNTSGIYIFDIKFQMISYSLGPSY